MKLLQLNVWGGRLDHLIGDLIEAEKPDIICLQEAISFSDGTRTGLFITVENIQKEYSYPYIAFEPTFTFNYMRGTAKFGNCIISRFPIVKNNGVFTHLEHIDNFHWGEHSSNMRNFVHAVIETPDRKLCNIITHHGYWIPEHKRGNDETKAHVKLIVDYSQKLDGPIIITGDFNLAPDSESIQQVDTVFTNLCAKHKVTTTRNELTYKTETCDYIFINDQVTEKNFRLSDKVVSDHKALFLDFEV